MQAMFYVFTHFVADEASKMDDKSKIVHVHRKYGGLVGRALER